MVRLPRGTGRYARGIVKEFMERTRPFEKGMPPYPIQNTLTGEMQQFAAKLNRPEFMSLWAGRLQRCHAPCPQRNW